MSNNVEINRKVSEMYGRNDILSTLGTTTEGLQTAEQVIEQHFDYDVKVTEHIVNDNPTGWYAVHPDYDESIIWQFIKNDGEGLHQPREVIQKGADVVSLFDNDLAMFSNSGKFGQNGGKYYAQIQLPQTISLANGDSIEPFLNIVSSHDGSVATRYFLSFVKISCLNTFMHAIRTADIEKTVKLKQTKNNGLNNPNISNIMADALGLVQTKIDMVQGDIETMINTPMNQADMIDYWCELENMPKLPMEKIPSGKFGKNGQELLEIKKGTRTQGQENILSTILACYAKEVEDLGTPPNTVYAAWNAFTGYQDHIATAVAEKDGTFSVRENKVSQRVIGAAADKKAKAYKMALAVSS